MIKINNNLNCKILEPSESEIQAVILYLSKITLKDESRLDPEIERDTDMIIEHYKMAKENLLYVLKIEVQTETIINQKQTFFHYSSMWDLSFPEGVYPLTPFINGVLIMENGLLSEHKV